MENTIIYYCVIDDKNVLASFDTQEEAVNNVRQSSQKNLRIIKAQKDIEENKVTLSEIKY